MNALARRTLVSMHSLLAAWPGRAARAAGAAPGGWMALMERGACWVERREGREAVDGLALWWRHRQVERLQRGSRWGKLSRGARAAAQVGLGLVRGLGPAARHGVSVRAVVVGTVAVGGVT